jgi:peptide/nickel transport system substrate-binding protein
MKRQVSFAGTGEGEVSMRRDEILGSATGGVTRRHFLELSGGALLAPYASRVAPKAAPSTTPAGPAGSVRFLMAENFWADWSPYASTALSQLRLERQVYDYLVDFPSGDLTKPEPMLATSWQQIDDLTWEFELRDGVTFHEGEQFTAEDVKASLELATGFSGESAYQTNWIPVEVEVVDPLRVRLRTEQPFGPMMISLWWYAPILSAAWLGGDPDQLKTQPNGTGPFRLVEDAVEVKTMEANLDYWRDPAKIGTLVWEFIQDPQTRLNALLDGSAQAIDRVPPEHLPLLEERDDVEMVSVTGIETVNLFVRPGRLPLWDENLDFRKAVNWSIDRQPLVDSLVLGNSRVAQSYIPVNTLFFQAQEPAYAFDPDMAATHLEAAGVPDGGPEFELWVAEGFLPRAPEVVQAIVAQMEQVGLKPRVVTADVAGVIDDIFTDGGTGAMYHLSWASSGDPHHAATLYSSQLAVWYFGDQQLQDLIDQGVTTVDPAQREQIYADLQARLWEQAWHVPLYNSDFTIAHTADLTGVLVQPNVFRTDFYTAELVG